MQELELVWLGMSTAGRVLAQRLDKDSAACSVYDFIAP